MREKSNIQKWIKNELEYRFDEYADNANLINLTKLAEEAAEEFDLYDEEYSIPDCIFHEVFLVADSMGLL